MVKILFLPHCLKKELSEQIVSRSKEKNYEIHIVGGGSIIKKITEQYLEEGKEIEKIIGIACQDEINLAMKFLKSKRLSEKSVFPLLLSVIGCKDTEIDLKQVWNVLD